MRHFKFAAWKEALDCTQVAARQPFQDRRQLGDAAARRHSRHPIDHLFHHERRSITINTRHAHNLKDSEDWATIKHAPSAAIDNQLTVNFEWIFS